MAETSGQSPAAGPPLVAVYVVTYRRHALLRRAIASAIAQTHANFRLLVVNDDPEDDGVARIVSGFGDPRVALHEPVAKRGATGSFALVYAEAEADYAALLEDDNWWEPGFLASQISVLEARPDMPVVVGNERIWKEGADGSWTDTGVTIWPFADLREHRFTLESVCGSAIFCNSSALIRVNRAQTMAVPGSIPVDVTEHFRERTFPETILLNGAPLTNYAETLSTARDTKGLRWGHYQQLLTGSCFAALQSATARRQLARSLWQSIDNPTSPRAVSLIMAGLATAPARALLRAAPWKSLIRGLLTVARRRGSLAPLRAQPAMAAELAFLIHAPLTQTLAKTADAAGHEVPL